MRPWVFVHLPEESTLPPWCFVLTQTQLHEILAPREAAYLERYKLKQGKDYGDKAGVVNVGRAQLEQFENNWFAITSQLAPTTEAPTPPESPRPI